MTAALEKVDIGSIFQPIAYYLGRPVRLVREYDIAFARPDLMAGLTVAVIMLPQAIAFALIAELPPVMGLYAAVVGSIIGALWGSADQVHNGPTNANSLLVLSALTSAAFVPGTDAFILAAGLMAVMAGLFQFTLGLARLGMLVNFVSYSVIVGFSAGAGILIAVKQFDPLLGISYAGSSLPGPLEEVAVGVPQIHLATAAIGVGSILLLVLLPRLSRRLPAALITMVVASLVVFALNLDSRGVGVIGELPSGLPPLVNLPIFNLDFISRLSAGALAVGAIGLVQTMAMARSIATQTGQRLNSNQEFVGQGLANIAVGFFSGFATAGSFSRSAVNVQAGARSPMAAVFSGIFVLIAMFALGPLAAYLPRAALAGVLVVIAFGLVDRAEIMRILRGTRGDAIIMTVTLFGTLFLPIELAVLGGILLSFVHYTLRTSMPRVHEVLPDAEFHHFIDRQEDRGCPQLRILDIEGDLYFGAVNHIEEEIHKRHQRRPERRYLLLRMAHVNHCDFSGIHMLENVVHLYREDGGDVFLTRLNHRVRQLMTTTGFDDFLGEDNFLEEDDAISHIFYQILDPAICVYECPVRAFKECQNLPKRTDEVASVPRFSEIAQETIIQVPARELWQRLNQRDGQRPAIIDVREPREYRHGHIPSAQLVPLPTILSKTVQFPNDRQLVFVCRSGRRSQRAAFALQKIGLVNTAVLEGGMLAWEAANLLQAVEPAGSGPRPPKEEGN